MSRTRHPRRHSAPAPQVRRVSPLNVALWRVIEIHLFMIEHACRMIRQTAGRLLV
jgi:hypothetical protein